MDRTGRDGLASLLFTLVLPTGQCQMDGMERTEQGGKAMQTILDRDRALFAHVSSLTFRVLSLNW